MQISSNFFQRRVGLLFMSLTVLQNPDGTTTYEGVKQRDRKISRISTQLQYILQTVRDKTMVGIIDKKS